ncbi:CYTH domain-containing protein [Streptosporangium sp. NBC_01639]|uniref:class IV adenylate cyclase n=1 Tax=Streptosporangium sp. NBC_01639 TaxID=2975948 RepID=UPI00386F16E0|nr:CYTH domain-containing protein [Streptosporangium sp. NBC_01639]
MPIEYEAKVLNIDPDRTADLITALGGGKVTGTRLMRRYVYDIAPGDMSRWIRLRDTGTEITLTVKEITDDGIDGTRETEVAVLDFETTDELLGKLGFTPKSYQENRRTSFTLDGAELEIDEWPGIPPYLEIEAGDRDHVIAVARRLGYDEEQLTGENTIKVYARYGIDLTAITDLRFDSEPAWSRG